MLGAGDRGKRESGLLCFLARQITAVRNYGGESAAKILHVARAILVGADVAVAARACALSVSHSLFRDPVHANKALGKTSRKPVLGSRAQARCTSPSREFRREAVRPVRQGSGSSARL